MSVSIKTFKMESIKGERSPRVKKIARTRRKMKKVMVCCDAVVCGFSEKRC